MEYVDAKIALTTCPAETILSLSPEFLNTCRFE